MILKDLGIRTSTIHALEKKKIRSAFDLCTFFPRKYRDYREIKLARECTPGEFAAFSGILMLCQKKKSSNGREYISLRIDQDDGTAIRILSFCNVYLFNTYDSYTFSRICVCGQLNYEPEFGYSISNPDKIFQIGNFKSEIMTVYSSVKGVSDSMLRSLIDKCVNDAKEPLPNPVLDEVNRLFPVPGYKDALLLKHHPQAPENVEFASRRLLFNDMLYFASMLEDPEESEYTSFGFPKLELLNEFLRNLPFQLTQDQNAAIVEMSKRAYYGKRINALVQGDVGCGKTILSIAMAINAYDNGYQSVLIAPREVLAKQHFDEISGYAEKYGIHCAFLHSGLKTAEKKKIYEGIASGETSIVVGTHACLSDAVTYKNLALLICDEEHLFGVAQKEKLLNKVKGLHYISMSATPIPRSLAMTLYGEGKQIIEIKTKPAGRLPIKTAIQSERERTMRFMAGQIRDGHQCYVVCPAIDENEDSGIVSIEEVEKYYHAFFDPFGVKIGVLNGQMSKQEIVDTIDSFYRGEIHILISTTVIEVGVNVPNATVMVIEQSDRFGLASLHQLRGRVGRSSLQSYCVLLTDDPQNERLKVLQSTNDGFKIAEADLQQRGTGSFCSTEQSGFNRFIDEMISNREIFESAKMICRQFRRTNYLDELIKMYEEGHEET